MLVMVLEKVPASVRGELSQWMIEPHPGVFVGNLSALVRDLLWDKCRASIRDGGAVQIWSTNNEQRYQIRMAGQTKREVVDFEGIQLVRLREEGKLEVEGEEKNG
jgi:CRISPR-associated protein Cas2